MHYCCCERVNRRIENYRLRRNDDLTLFFSLDRWNEWFTSMIFIRRTEITPLQLVLRSIVLSGDYIQQMGDLSLALSKPFSKGLKMAAVIVTMAPIMLFYPFLQKYFVKGIMIGALKG